jgi:hypothetical protein
LNELVANLFLNFVHDFDKVMAMRRSDVTMLFGSKAMKEWQKAREAQGRMDLAICDRLDNVIRAIGSLGKAMTSRPR